MPRYLTVIFMIALSSIIVACGGSSASKRWSEVKDASKTTPVTIHNGTNTTTIDRKNRRVTLGNSRANRPMTKQDIAKRREQIQPVRFHGHQVDNPRLREYRQQQSKYREASQRNRFHGYHKGKKPVPPATPYRRIHLLY